MEKNEFLLETITILEKRVPCLKAIYHFGSTANSTANRDSDIDLAFLGPQRIDSIQRWEIQEELARIFSRNVDLIDLNFTNDVMRFQIITTGKRIYHLDFNEMEHFENNVYSMYLDLNEQRKGILEEFQDSGSVYG